MRLDPVQSRDRFSMARVLRLATIAPDGEPHLVPCTFVVDTAGRVAIGIDNKPKSTVSLRRLANIEANPHVSMIVDHYSEDWDTLWWVRADGVAAIERSGDQHAGHWDQLRRKYPQYAGQDLGGPVILVKIDVWTGWAAR
jgi:PPOX class probable F420-dependent enzyme